MSKDLKMKATVQRVVHMLVHGEYEALERLSDSVRLTASEMAEAIDEYGRKLIYPPEEVFDSLDIVEVSGAQSKIWSVNVGLWTVEEGRSDLTLELTLKGRGKGEYDVEIDDIHAL